MRLESERKKWGAVLAVALALGMSGSQGLAAEQTDLEWGVHLFSLHTKSGFNNFNPGVYVQHHTGWAAGVFKNSYSRTSVYGGYMWRKQRCGGPELFLGAATGYEDDTGGSKGLAPVFAPSYSWCLDGVVSAARLSWFVDPRQDAAQALHFSISFR